MARISRTKLKQQIRDFRKARKTKDELEESIKADQPALLAFLKEFDPENTGFVFDGSQPDGKNAAFRSGGDNTPEGERAEVWNMEAVVDFINKDPKLRKRCVVPSVSIAKFEAEVAAGNVSAAAAKGLKSPKAPSAEYIRFGAPKPNSK